MGAFIGLFMVITVAIILFSATRDEFITDDVGDSFEKMNAVAAYADERLAAAANGESLPRPPAILANQSDLRFALVMTGVSQVFLVALVIMVSRQGVSGFVRQTGMDRIHLGRVWLIAGCVILAYIGTFLYSVAAAASGIGWLEPTSTVPAAVIRDDTTLLITGIVTLVGAPISEEMFFRGLLLSGFSRWGAIVAAIISGFLFSLVHFDPGSFIPFVGIALGLGWLYWRRGSLWDSIAFHFLFNATSFSIMVATR